jgi:acyl dehydratase
MTVNLDAVGTETAPVERSWTSKDALLYAVGVGAGAEDPLAELQYTTENSRGVDQEVLPTFAVIVGGGLPPLSAVGEINMAALVHGEQGIELYRPIPPDGSVRTTSRLTHIYDKGSGMVVGAEMSSVDPATGEPVMKTTMSVFIRGAGGFGGERGPSGPANPPPDRAPDHTVVYRTREDQALTYRLSGDRNPLHSDPEFAKLAGFPRPILHGLCTYGFTGRALLHTLAGSESARFRSMYARFSKPVMPGDTLTVKVWEVGEGSAVYTTENQHGDVCITDGSCTFDPA